MIEAIVVRTIRLGMVRRRQHRHLVPINRIAPEKVLHLIGHLLAAALMPPVTDQPTEHAERTAMLLLAQSSENTQFRVAHSHILFVRLGNLAIAQRLQFGGWWLLEDALQHGNVELAFGVDQELLEIGLGDATDRIDIGRRAIVFGHIAAKRFVHIGRAEDEQTAGTIAHPQHELGEQVGEHHARAGLSQTKNVHILTDTN